MAVKRKIDVSHSEAVWPKNQVMRALLERTPKGILFHLQVIDDLTYDQVVELRDLAISHFEQQLKLRKRRPQ